jgi:DNA-binding winged helix-turn-helix (wHTH) protein
MDRRSVRFGVFDLDLRTGELRKKGCLVHLEEQPFQVLAMLLQNAGELVTRDELQARLWSNAVFVDFEAGLNKCVAKIRAALGDLAESPRYVETLKRRGYRFIAAVETIGHEASPPIAASPTAAVSPVTACAVRLIKGEDSVALSEGSHVIGRDPAAAVWIDSPVVSRRHAAVTLADGCLGIEDLGSRNGTFVNGVQVTARVPLAHGDKIDIGPASLTVYIATSQTATAPVND